MSDENETDPLEIARLDAVSFRETEADKQRRHLRAAAIAGANVANADKEIAGLEQAIKRRDGVSNSLVDSDTHDEALAATQIVPSTTAAIRAVLRQADRPLKNGEIQEGVIALGVTPSKASTSSIGALLIQARDIERVGREGWALIKP